MSRAPAVAVTVTLFLAAAVAAPAQEWSIEPVGIGTKPEIALYPDGQPHIAFMTEELHGGVFFARRGDDGWTVETVSEGYFYGPLDLVTGADGTSHIVYHDHQDGQFQPELGDAVYATDGDGGWQLETIKHPGHDGWDGTIALGPDGGVHVASIDPSQFGSPDGVEWARRSAGTWTVVAIGSGPIPYEFGTAIAIDEAGRPHIAYHDGSERFRPDAGGSDLIYVSLDAGGDFVSEVVDAAGDVGKFPSMALDRVGGVHLAYFERTGSNAGDVKYAWQREDGSWSTEVIGRLDDVTIAFHGARRTVSLALDGSDRAHVAYCDRSGLHLARRGDDGAWQVDPVAVPSEDMDLGQLVSLALDPDGRRHLAFYELPESSSSTTGQILYAVDTTPRPTAVGDQAAGEPAAFALDNIYPNPFNGSTVIPYRLERAGPVELALYDLRGVRVRTLIRAPQAGGSHQVSWDGTDSHGRAVASGVYLAWLRVAGGGQVRKLALLR